MWLTGNIHVNRGKINFGKINAYPTNIYFVLEILLAFNVY